MGQITAHPMPFTSALQAAYLRAMRQQFPFVYCKTLTKTAYGRPIHALQIGSGNHKVLLTAGHHANESITCLLLWQLLDDYCTALRDDGFFAGQRALDLYHHSMLYCVPMVNPDGIDLVNGSVDPGSDAFAFARSIADRYPQFSFPKDWKANLCGVDLNLNYPANWQKAKQIKSALGICGPAPRDYPGAAPLDQPECAALAAYTCCIHPDLMIAWHTQGAVIYPDFSDIRPTGSSELANIFSAVSGYAVEPVPAASSNAGFKDWFLQRFCRPGFTIEAGRGENPLPLSQLPQLYRENIGIFAAALNW